MAVRFIFGRSGSGKTYHCLESIRSELITSAQGPPLIMLVPEQATFQMEQALVAGSHLRGYHRARVMSFERMAHSVLLETTPPAYPVLSETARQMILRRLLQQHRHELAIFDRAALRSGFVTRLSGMIRELRQYQKTPDQLYDQHCQLIAAEDAAMAPLAEKLADLALIYQSYLNFIKGRFIDPDDFLDLLALRCSQSELLSNACLWVDGFAGFTPQQYNALAAVVSAVRETHISLCLDPSSRQFHLIEANSITNLPLDQTDLFHPTLQTFHRLRQFIISAGLSLSSPIVLPEIATSPAHLPRFSRSSPLALLERNLFQPTRTAAENPESDVPTTEETISFEDIVIVEAAHRRSETEAVARHIIRLCRDHNYRFRDIAVILRDFTDYLELLEAAFTDHQIPYFIDQRRPVRHHPLVELLRSALQVLSSDFVSDFVFNYLKTDLVPLSRPVIDSLENYVLSHDIQTTRWYGQTPWLQPDQSALLSEEEMNQYRLQVVKPLLQMRQNLFGPQCETQSESSVLDITTELFSLLENLQVPQTLSRWHQQASAEGDFDRAQQHEQIYEDILNLMDDLTETLGDNRVTLTDYTEILCSALEQMTLRLIPPVLDQVLIGSVERSRHPHIRAAFVLGVNEGRFPQAGSPDTFFSDNQRDRLLEDGFELAPSSRENRMHERYLSYIALTRPHDFLWVSFVIADEKGTSLNPSSLIEHIRSAVDNIPYYRLNENYIQPDTSRMVTPTQLGRELAVAFGAFHRRESIDPFWQELYFSALGQSPLSKCIQKSLAGITWHNDACLDRQLAPLLYPDPLTGSVSQLETFAACPFRHFARYTLQLQPREELKLAAPDMGTFYHAFLCAVFRRMQKDSLNWPDLSDDQLDNLITTTIDTILQQDNSFRELKQQSSRNHFLLQESSRRLQRFCHFLRAAGSLGRFRQCEAELSFGLFPDGLDSLQLGLSDGRRLHLRGKIDRIDICPGRDDTSGLMVIDYKSSSLSFPFARFYHGLSLQLISYLLVILENYRPENGQSLTPVAVLYLPINLSGRSRNELPPMPILESQFLDQPPIYKATGLIDGDWIKQLDHSVRPKQYSKYFNFYINKDGSVYNSKSVSVVTSDQFGALLDHCRRKLIDLADAVAHGNIAVSPYSLGLNDTPCAHCEFKSLCRFDFSTDPYRQLENYNKNEVLEKILYTHRD